MDLLCFAVAISTHFPGIDSLTGKYAQQPLSSPPVPARSVPAYPSVPLTSLDLNRTAEKVAAPPTPAHTGFRWEQGDKTTPDWRPQGIAGIAGDVAGTRNFVIVSWYDYTKGGVKGVRLSFVDVTNMDAPIRYRHVLLVDEFDRPFTDMHAGGLVYRNKQIHVPDSRGEARSVHLFSIDAILDVPAQAQANYFGYRYILRRTGGYPVDMSPSFMSYDWSRDKLLIGHHYKCVGNDTHLDSSGCMSQSPAACSLEWKPLAGAGALLRSHFFTEMQGAAADGNSLWVSCSYGRWNRSHVHVGNYDPASGNPANPSSWKVYVFPPGLEAIHVALSSDNLWTLTEFGPHEGGYFDPPLGGQATFVPNQRLVIAIRKERMSP